MSVVRVEEKRVSRHPSDKGWQDSLLRVAPHSQSADADFSWLSIPPKAASMARHHKRDLEYYEVLDRSLASESS